MEGELDPFEYDLAETLGCTVSEMHDRISNQEYLQWRALAVYRTAKLKLEADSRANRG